MSSKIKYKYCSVFISIFKVLGVPKTIFFVGRKKDGSSHFYLKTGVVSCGAIYDLIYPFLIVFKISPKKLQI